MSKKLLKIPKTWEELKKMVDILPHCNGFDTRFIKDKNFYESYNNSLTVEEKVNNIYKKMGDNEICLLPNNYPYTRMLRNLPNVKHFCLWSRRGLLEPKIVDQKITELFPQNDFFWFENDFNVKSIPEIWHCHVFIKI